MKKSKAARKNKNKKEIALIPKHWSKLPLWIRQMCRSQKLDPNTVRINFHCPFIEFRSGFEANEKVEITITGWKKTKRKVDCPPY